LVVDPEEGEVPTEEAQAFRDRIYIITRFRPTLMVDFLGAGELVVVERPLVDVLAGLPPAFFKPKYGAS
jgi:U3 small nucleolar RNA-associated protein 4